MPRSVVKNPEQRHHRLIIFLKELACILLMTACVAIPSAFAKGHRSTYAQGGKRDSQGHIARSESAKKQFEKQTATQMEDQGTWSIISSH